MDEAQVIANARRWHKRKRLQIKSRRLRILLGHSQRLASSPHSQPATWAHLEVYLLKARLRKSAMRSKRRSELFFDEHISVYDTTDFSESVLDVLKIELRRDEGDSHELRINCFLKFL